MLDNFDDDTLVDALYEYLLHHPICDLLKVLALVIEAKEMADAGV